MRFFSNEIKMKWLNALGSGKYEVAMPVKNAEQNGTLVFVDKTTGRTKYSPLGVLANEYGKLNRRGWFHHYTSYGRSIVGSPHGLHIYNPELKDFEFFFGLGPETQKTVLDIIETKGLNAVVTYIAKLEHGKIHK